MIALTALKKDILYFGAPEKLERRNSLFRRLCVIAGILLVYYIFVRITGLSIPCLFRLVTKLRCPGCGITHLFLHAAKLEWREAFMSNALIFVLLPFAGVLMAAKLLFMPDCLDMKSKPYRTGEKILLAAVLLFGVVRNIIGV